MIARERGKLWTYIDCRKSLLLMEKKLCQFRTLMICSYGNKLICIKCKHCILIENDLKIRFMVKKIPLKVLVIYILKLTVSYWQENNLRCIWTWLIFEKVEFMKWFHRQFAGCVVCFISELKITESFCLLYSGHRRFWLETYGETVVYAIRVCCRLMTCVHGYK